MEENKSGKLPAHSDIGQAFKWKLEDIYPGIEEWEADFNKVKDGSSSFLKYKGHLGDSSSVLFSCMEEYEQLMSINDKVFVYARMKRDEDNGNPLYQGLNDRAMALATEAYAQASFIVPELLSIDESRLVEFVETYPKYKQFIDECLRQKKHVLSERDEELLALTSEMAHAPQDIFTMFNNADIRFPEIKDEKGEAVELTKGRYMTFLENRDRRVRKDAFEALYSSYSSHRNTLAASLTNSIKKDKFYSSVRFYDSSLEAALDSDNVSTDVYNSLIEAVNNHLNVLHRYMKLRKRVLGLDELHMYDLYVPIIDMPHKHIPYEEAVKIVKNGLSPMGEEYNGYLNKAFTSGWVDVYESQGKTSGAYSWGSYLTHPYVLLNYQGNINDVFTIAHEMGHALHSFYTNKTQPYTYSEYKIFVAEVASTVNETLLMDYMLKNASDNKEKAYLLNHQLEEFRGTLFRQVMFAEFEKLTHAKLGNGEALTAQELCDIYRGLNVKYYGQEAVIDPQIDMEWSRIPHFYNSFYVYKYATGYSAATALSTQILSEGKPALDRYIGFLKGGSSDYPLELLKSAGVDLSTPKPVEAALKVFEKTLDELEKLI